VGLLTSMALSALCVLMRECLRQLLVAHFPPHVELCGMEGDKCTKIDVHCVTERPVYNDVYLRLRRSEYQDLALVVLASHRSISLRGRRCATKQPCLIQINYLQLAFITRWTSFAISPLKHIECPVSSAAEAALQRRLGSRRRARRFRYLYVEG
jgi:hypothetical protein